MQPAIGCFRAILGVLVAIMIVYWGLFLCLLLWKLLQLPKPSFSQVPCNFCMAVSKYQGPEYRPQKSMALSYSSDTLKGPPIYGNSPIAPVYQNTQTACS